MILFESWRFAIYYATHDAREANGMGLYWAIKNDNLFAQSNLRRVRQEVNMAIKDELGEYIKRELK